MDIEKMSNIDISQDSVKSISEKCNQLKDLQKQIEDQEDKLKTLKNKSKDLEERVIPEMMQEAGVSLLKLKDGSKKSAYPWRRHFHRGIAHLAGQALQKDRLLERARSPEDLPWLAPAQNPAVIADRWPYPDRDH